MGSSNAVAMRSYFFPKLLYHCVIVSKARSSGAKPNKAVVRCHMRGGAFFHVEMAGPCRAGPFLGTRKFQGRELGLTIPSKIVEEVNDYCNQ